jgi:menaquinone-dependent protoporphyrinogen IX oxidase
MTVTKPIFTKFTFARQPFVKKSYTVLHENPTNVLVTDTMYQAEKQQDKTDGQTKERAIHIQLILRKERLK